MGSEVITRLNRFTKVVSRSMCLLVTLLLPSTSFAGIDKLIKNVFPEGTASNVTNSAIVQEQSAGHVIGGSVIIKTPHVPDLQLLNVEAPSCKLGGLPCGAQIDLRAGGFSFIKSAELGRFVKQIGQQAPSYATMMLLQSISPQIASVLSWLNDKAQEVNALSLNSCRTMEMLAGGAMSVLSAGSQATQQSAMVLSGKGNDMTDFQTNSKHGVKDPTLGVKELEGQVGDNFNLVWKALDKKASGNTEANELKELLMSISGTIICEKDDNSKFKFTHKKSLVTNGMIQDFLGTENGSGEIKLYKCDKEYEKCLSLKTHKQKLVFANTLKGKITELLKSIATKIQTGKGKFTQEEESLTALASIPIINKMELDLATYSNFNHALHAQNEFVEALCFDVITSYFGQLLLEVQDAVSELSYVQIGGQQKIFKDFEQEARETMRSLYREKNLAFKRYELIAATKARIQQEIKEFHRKFEEQMNL